ncbi:MAG: hypothetical protein HY037_00835 [Nitrospirae bacterium]|nr:hypothetical protein [Candidatus Troglogloeales bacterium]
MKATLTAINEMQDNSVIGKYAIGGAVGATFYLEPSATLDIDIFVSIQTLPGSSLITIATIYDYLANISQRFRFPRKSNSWKNFATAVWQLPQTSCVNHRVPGVEILALRYQSLMW